MDTFSDHDITYLLLYLYCNSLFICDVHGEFGLIIVHLFDILPSISSRKVREKSMDFFSVESSNPVYKLTFTYLLGWGWLLAWPPHTEAQCSTISVVCVVSHWCRTVGTETSEVTYCVIGSAMSLTPIGRWWLVTRMSSRINCPDFPSGLRMRCSWPRSTESAAAISRMLSLLVLENQVCELCGSSMTLSGKICKSPITVKE